MVKRKGEHGQEVPLIHRSMSVEIAVDLIGELSDLIHLSGSKDWPQSIQLLRDLKDITHQLRNGDVKRPC